MYKHMYNYNITVYYNKETFLPDCLVILKQKLTIELMND